MKLIEIIFAINILAIISLTALLPINIENKTRSALTSLYALKQARILALIDSSTLGRIEFGDIYSFKRVDSKRLIQVYEPFFWQIQFHTSGIYTKNSMSIYRDTPRFASTTDYDRRPLAGDFVALLGDKCLSGYNNTNITGICKNNALFHFRLFESNKLKEFSLATNSSCRERDTFRFYFNDFGEIMCGNRIHKPSGTQIVKVGDFSLLIESNTGYSFIMN